MSSRLLCCAFAYLLVSYAAVSAATETTSPEEIAVHILERFTPLDTVTLIGPYLPVYEEQGFRLMMSFKAFQFNPANAAAMNCFFMDQDSQAWLPMSTAEGAKQRTEEPAFCARRNFTKGETPLFTVGMFKRVSFHDKNQQPRFLVDAAPTTSDIVSTVFARGWRDLPIASIRVTKFQRWRTAPSMTLVTEIQVVRADNLTQAAALCPPHPNGYDTRKLEGGNFYAGAESEKLAMLCVSYVRRYLHDLEARESFYTLVRFRDRSILRFYTCGLEDHSVREAVTRNAPVFNPYKGKKRLMCYRPESLVKDLDSTERLEGTSKFVKRVYFDESFGTRNERLRMEYHEKNALDFPLQDIDMNAVHSF